MYQLISKLHLWNGISETSSLKYHLIWLPRKLKRKTVDPIVFRIMGSHSPEGKQLNRIYNITTKKLIYVTFTASWKCGACKNRTKGCTSLTTARDSRLVLLLMLVATSHLSQFTSYKRRDLHGAYISHTRLNLHIS